MKLFIKQNRHRIFIPLIIGGIVTIVYVFLVSYLETMVEDKLVAINGKTSSIDINLISRSLKIQNLELYPSGKVPYSIRLRTLHITGVDLYQLLKNNRIQINRIKADSGKIIYDKSIEREALKRQESKVKSITIQNTSFINIIAEMRTDTIIDASAVFNFNASETSIEFDSVMKYSVKAFDGDVNEINISRNSGMYGVHITNFRFNSNDKKVIVDSLLLIPNYGKYEFSRKLGEQVGRLNLSVPRLTIEGIEIESIFDSLLTATKIEITSFDLHSFKDKRVPFLRTKNIPLPMERFLELPYTITVDSLVITDSRITIEEIAEEGSESGTITFDHVQAHASRFGNRYQKNDRAFVTLNATGLLMGTGNINASFSFPLDGSPTYGAKGAISKMPFEKLNPILENLVRLRIESGKLNNLKFDFQYTDLQSTGSVEIDYEDLSITSLKKKNNDTNEVKTIFINTFVKNDKTRKSLSKLKRTGTINIERDRKRYIFNVWLKSILDGLKSSILGIEKRPSQKE